MVSPVTTIGLPDPITGGKIVIQAKRYTRTVGVNAVRDLFGLKLGDFPKLKDQLNSLVRNGLIHVDAERISHRNRRSLPECELTTLFNATLLLAIFPDPAMVKSIFVNAEARRKAATFADLIVMNRQSLLELVHLRVLLVTFAG